MIDIHSHILPGLDDGPRDFAESMEMSKNAINKGITHIYATPHHMNGRFENYKQDILNHVKEFNRLLQEENIPLTIHPGQEVQIHYDLLSSLNMDEILTLDNNGQYLLIELPSGEAPFYTQDLIYELLLKGITPIIAHPERNKGFYENHNLLLDLVLEGALTQLTSGSIIGSFGKRVKRFAERIIEHQLAHFISSDAHNQQTRGLSLKEAYDSITKKYGISQTFFFQENAELILLGQQPYKEQPLSFRNKFLGVF